MRIVRMIFANVYIILSLVFMRCMFGKYISSVHAQDTAKRLIVVSIIELFCATMACIYGIAWWSILWERTYGRRWATVANFASIMLSVVVHVYYCVWYGLGLLWRQEPYLLIPAALGAIGMYIYGRDRTRVAQVSGERSKLPHK
jgi:hypothetical protein